MTFASRAASPGSLDRSALKARLVAANRYFVEGLIRITFLVD